MTFLSQPAGGDTACGRIPHILDGGTPHSNSEIGPVSAVRVIAEDLAENAIRYAGEGAVFTFSVRRDGDRLELTGSDTGAGVAASDLPRLLRALGLGPRRARRAAIW